MASTCSFTCILCGGDVTFNENGCSKCASIHKGKYNHIAAKLTKWPKLSLGEGNTPLVKSKTFDNVYYKNEGQNPTGSFKDRQSAIMVKRAMNRGANGVLCASSGNAAVSVSLYAKAGGLPCKVFVPASTKKLALLKKLGAEIVGVEGTFEDAYAQAIQFAKLSKGWYNCTPGINPLSLEGSKRIAYELCEFAPKTVVVPCGDGINLAGIWKGFKELHSKGKLTILPKLIGVQMKGGDPIGEYLKTGKIQVLDAPDSTAEGIIANESYGVLHAAKAIKESDGKLISISENVLKPAQQTLLSEGIICELTSAAAFCAIEKLDKSKGKCVIVITGSGLKTAT